MTISVKTMVMVMLGVTAFVLTGWAVLRYWEYEQQAPFRAGISALKSGDYHVALNNIRPFAESGDSHAQEVLGMIYAFGLGIPKDTLRARIWFRRAQCNSGRAGVSEYYVALDYMDKGQLAPIDPAQALQWLEYAAEAGNSDAQRVLSSASELRKKDLVAPPEVIKRWRRFMESK